MTGNRLALVVALVAAGALARFAYLDAPPLDFHATRQYRSALIARAQSPVALAALTPAQQSAAVQAGALALIEPPIIESIAKATYTLADVENLQWPRGIAALVWILGAIATGLMVARTDRDGWGLVAALAICLFTPYSIEASRAFMPDPLMVGLMLAAMAAAVRHHAAPSAFWQATRLILAAAAIIVKPMAGLFLSPAFILLDMRRQGLRGLGSGVLTIAVASVPVVIYYAWLLSSGSSIGDRRFYPELWSRASFWSGWLAMAGRVIGLPLLALALTLACMARGPLARIIAGGWIGYLVQGFVFSHHTSTHDYYSLPIIPLAALSVGAGLPALLARVAPARRTMTAVLVMVVAAVSLGLTPSARAPWGDVERARAVAKDYERVGTLTGHSLRVVTLDGSYGYPVAYHAMVATQQLPLSIDRSLVAVTGGTLPSGLAKLRAVGGQYFLGTVKAELDADPPMRDWLAERALLVDRAGPEDAWRHVLYDLDAQSRATQTFTPNPADVSAPFGWTDSPGDPVTLGTERILLQGWALDDRALARIDIVAQTPAGPRRLGQATRGGRRPDVAAAHPTAAELDRSAWAFALMPEDRDLLLTGLQIIAVDATGRTAVIGARTVVIAR